MRISTVAFGASRSGSGTWRLVVVVHSVATSSPSTVTASSIAR